MNLMPVVQTIFVALGIASAALSPWVSVPLYEKAKGLSDCLLPSAVMTFPIVMYAGHYSFVVRAEGESLLTWLALSTLMIPIAFAFSLALNWLVIVKPSLEPSYES